jgi:hypothetical protein
MVGALEQYGLRVWVAERDLVSGEATVDAMARALKSSVRCFFLYGKEGAGRWEHSLLGLLGRFIETDALRVVLVLLPGSDVEELPPELRLYGALDLRQDISDEGALAEEGLMKMLAAEQAVSVRDFMGSRSFGQDG